MSVTLEAGEIVSIVPARRRVANVIVETLSELGVDTVYGIPGGAISSVYDALIDNPHIRIINTRHESSAMFMAMGQAKAGGSMPCVLMTAGPGITNAITGLAAAHADGVPLIAIGGEVPRKNFGRGALQEGSRYHLDVLGMVRSVSKYAAEISNPRAAAQTVRKAIATARSGRQGPVFLSLPIDVANDKVMPLRSAAHAATTFTIDEELVQIAADSLQRCERGLILVGSGCRHPESVRWIGTLAATLNIPVATTPRAKGIFPESDPLSLGVFGLAGHTSAIDYLEQGVDTLLCVGCGLGEVETNGWSPMLQPSRTFIQIDIDAAQIGKNYQVDVGLVGPSHVVLAQLVSKVYRRQNAISVSGVHYLQPETTESEQVPLNPARVISELQALAPAETIFTSDIGEHAMFALHYLSIDQPDGFIINTGLGSMGSGIGAAIGAKVAKPHRPVVSISGDYGFQMVAMELATCMESKIGVVFAIFNDGRMRMVESGQNTVFGRTKQMDGVKVDFTAVANSVGARSYKIRKPMDFAMLPEDLFESDFPTVLDIEIDPRARFPDNSRVEQVKTFNKRQ